MKGFSFGLLLFISYSAFSQWNSDSLTRNIVCNAARNQFYARSCSDGSGGAILPGLMSVPQTRLLLFMHKE